MINAISVNSNELVVASAKMISQVNVSNILILVSSAMRLAVINFDFAVFVAEEIIRTINVSAIKPFV